MSKLLKQAKPSKLNSVASCSRSGAPGEERVTRKMKPKEYPRSFRVDDTIINILKDTLYKVNEISVRKIGEAKLIKSLIFLSKNMSADKILKASKEVW